MPQQRCDAVETARKDDPLGACHQEPKRDGLGVTVRESLVRSVGKKRSAPIGGQAGQRGAAKLHLLDHFVSQKAAQARADLREFRCGAGRTGIPAQKIREQPEQARGRAQRGAGTFDRAVQPDDLAMEVAILPEAEGIAVGVDQVRQQFEFLPLLLVVWVAEPARIGSLARRLQLDEPDQQVLIGYGEVGPRLQVLNRGLADEDDIRGPSERRDNVLDQLVQWAAQLILWRTRSSYSREFRLETNTEARNRFSEGIGPWHCFSNVLRSTRLHTRSDDQPGPFACLSHVSRACGPITLVFEDETCRRALGAEDEFWTRVRRRRVAKSDCLIAVYDIPPIMTGGTARAAERVLPGGRGYIGWGKSHQLGTGPGLAIGAKVAASDKDARRAR